MLLVIDTVFIEYNCFIYQLQLAVTLILLVGENISEYRTTVSREGNAEPQRPSKEEGQATWGHTLMLLFLATGMEIVAGGRRQCISARWKSRVECAWEN